MSTIDEKQKSAVLDEPVIDYTRYYQWWHDDSDKHFEDMATSESRWLAPLLPQSRSSRILDIGCGMGFAVGGMQKSGYSNVQGIDADAGQIAKARRRGLPVRHVPLADFATWCSTEYGTFDAVTSIDVLEHVPMQHQLGFLQNVLNLLKPGGTFICRVPNASASIAARYRYGDWTHYTSFTEHSLDFVLYTAGFRDIAVQEADPFRWSVRTFARPGRVLLGFYRLWRKLEMIAEFGYDAGVKVPVTPNIFAIARRRAREEA
jgi:2-polyprenyl-3-methyl-5-hydroxy-6-metoxy-1,4-benzoquinol methylase